MSAESYINSYRNAWGAATAAARQAYDDAVRRRGRPVAGRPNVPLSELAVPVPLSRFVWPTVRLWVCRACKAHLSVKAHAVARLHLVSDVASLLCYDDLQIHLALLYAYVPLQEAS